MSRKEFPAEKTVDRETERDIFTKLLKFENEARLLVIQDEEETGKTTLLRRLQFDCEWIHELPSVLVSLELETIGTDFDLISAIRDGLSRPSFDLAFDVYDALNKMRVSKKGQALATFAGAIEGTADATEADIEGKGHRFAGVLIEQLINLEVGEWTSELEELVRKECIQAFFADLHQIADKQPVVILLDSYDKRCNPALQQWILSSFVRPLCFGEDRPEKLVVVLAGRPAEGVPNFETFGAGKYKQFVTSIRSLAQWSEDHVKEWLKLHGYDVLTDEDRKFVWTRVQSGCSIGKALLLADILRDTAAQ
jgi:hypothetical protein